MVLSIFYSQFSGIAATRFWSAVYPSNIVPLHSLLTSSVNLGKPVKNKVIPIQYKIEEKQYIEAIEKAYIFASQTLLDLVIKEKDLIGRLRSVKHYFLLDQGDFIVTFLTLCEKEFGKYVVDVNQGCIESLMDLALRLSSAISDPYKDDLKTELLPYDLQFQMFKILSIQTNSEQGEQMKKKLCTGSFRIDSDEDENSK